MIPTRNSSALIRTLLLSVSVSLAFAFQSPANPHFFPRLKPLFVGLDESKLSKAAAQKLAKAKVDFAKIKHGHKPVYAVFTGELPHSNSLAYAGDGYRLIMVHNYLATSHVDGPEIDIDSSITGAAPYHYDEIDEVID